MKSDLRGPSSGLVLSPESSVLAPGEHWIWVPFEVDKQFDGLRVDQYLSRRLVAYSRSKVQKILQESRVMLADRLVKSSTRIRTGDKISIAYPRRPEEPLDSRSTMPVLYEDEHLMVVHKPARLLSHPTDKIVTNTVLGVLRHVRPDLGKLFLLHRLDRDTSGVLALAKSSEAARRWTQQMETRQIHKEYLAVVYGVFKARQGIIDLPIGRQDGDIKVRQWVNVPKAVPARTRYQVLWSKIRCSLVHAFPETGRLHQIRVHFAASGHPLFGDLLYLNEGKAYLKMVSHTLTDADREKAGFERLALHAAALTFQHPMTEKKLRVTAPLPEDFRRLLSSLGCPVVTPADR